MIHRSTDSKATTTRHTPRRRRATPAIALAVTLAIVAAACGDDDDTTGDTAGQSDTTTATSDGDSTEADGTTTNGTDDTDATDDTAGNDDGATAVAEVPDPVPSDSPDARSIEDMLAPYDEFGTDAAPGEFPRTIQHAMGETTIEEEPTRVVTLDTGELDTAIELGITPVGAVDYGSDGLPEYFSPEEVDGIEVVGTIQELNFEQIKQLDPDLILSSKLRHEEHYDLLSDIAPTVFADGVGVSWKQNFELFAQALGREDQADDTVARYEHRVTELNAVLPNPRPTVSITRIMADTLRLYQRANFLAIVLTDLGFPRPEAQNVDDFGVDVSLERIPDADADVILLAVFDVTENSYMDRVLDSPLWQSLSGVQNDALYEVDDQTWLGGIGYHAAFEIMDRAEEMFAS